MNDIGFTDKEISDIRKDFTQYELVNEVVIYGSRAMGNFKPSSDIDLSLKGEIDRSLESDIFFDLDDLMLPYKFDLTIYDKINNSDLVEHIDKQGVVLYLKKDKFI